MKGERASAARRDVSQAERLEPLGLAVEIQALNGSRRFREANVVKARERRARYGANAVVRHEELLL